jgi:site-specific recombinase XerD
VPGRRKRNRQRPISAKRTLSTLQRIAGYVVNIRGGRREQLTFDMFFDKNLVTEFLAWLSSERQLRQTTMFTDVILLLSMGLRYKKLDERELLWLSQLRDQLEDARPRDKSWKMVPLEELRSIPDKLRNERIRLERRMKSRRNRPSLATWARAVRNELIFELITARPLRSRNIREAKIGRNIFKTSDGRWRLLFEGQETKVGNTLSFFIPESLEPSLELYLDKARPILAEGNSSDILFVSDTGKPLSSGGLRNVVKEQCMKYLGKPVTPHVIRDIVAHAILSKNPEDYLKVSKLLGHKRVETTLRIYGHYEMDDAARSYDEMLEPESEFDEQRADSDDDKETKKRGA